MVDQVEIFLIHHVQRIKMIRESLVQVENDFTDELVLHKQIEVRLVWKLALCPGAVISDEKHQKRGKLVAIRVCDCS